MTETTIPVWREALSQREHELYQAAWTVFMQNMDVDIAVERLEDEKDKVIPFLIAIVQDEDLYDRDAFGDGNAPVNAVRLLGHWKVREALPALLDALAESESYQPTYRPLMDAIMELGHDIVDDILLWAEEDEDRRGDAAFLFSAIGRGNQKAYDAVLSWIQPDELDLDDYADWLTDIDPERAAADLRSLANNRDFEKEERKTFRSKSAEAYKTARQRQKLAAEAASAEAEASEVVADSDTESAETDTEETAAEDTPTEETSA